jgi:hypothetical protein
MGLSVFRKQPMKQIRLLITEDLVRDLNILSKAHSISRLALLRRYIRDEIKLDLERIREDAKQWEGLDLTRHHIQSKVRSR